MPGFAFFEPVLIFTLLNVTMALGLYITALSGQLSMATAAIAGVGAYTSAILTAKWGWPFLPAIVLAATAGAAVGAVLALITLRMRDFILKLTTLAFGEALSVLAFNWDYIGGANSFTGITLYTSFRNACWRPCSRFMSLGASTARGSGLRHAPCATTRLRHRPWACRCSRLRIITFALGSAVVGFGGAMQAHYVLVISPSDLGFFVRSTSLSSCCSAVCRRCGDRCSAPPC